MTVEESPHPRCDALQRYHAERGASAWQSMVGYRELARQLEQELNMLRKTTERPTFVGLARANNLQCDHGVSLQVPCPDCEALDKDKE
jgi:hypothetical protein